MAEVVFVVSCVSAVASVFWSQSGRKVAADLEAAQWLSAEEAFNLVRQRPNEDHYVAVRGRVVPRNVGDVLVVPVTGGNGSSTADAVVTRTTKTHLISAVHPVQHRKEGKRIVVKDAKPTAWGDRGYGKLLREEGSEWLDALHRQVSPPDAVTRRATELRLAGDPEERRVEWGLGSSTRGGVQVDLARGLASRAPLTTLSTTEALRTRDLPLPDFGDGAVRALRGTRTTLDGLQVGTQLTGVGVLMPGGAVGAQLKRSALRHSCLSAKPVDDLITDALQASRFADGCTWVLGAIAVVAGGVLVYRHLWPEEWRVAALDRWLLPAPVGPAPSQDQPSE